jgi:DNA-binding NtrC family response regulator
MAHPKILIVDDQVELTESLTRFFESHGYSADSANDPRTAIEMMVRSLYKIVLCDVQMPGMTGLELLREFKRRHPMAVVMMMTGYHDIDIVVSCLEAGAYDFFPKPVEPLDVLLEAVQEAEQKLHRWARALSGKAYSEPQNT